MSLRRYVLPRLARHRVHPHAPPAADHQPARVHDVDRGVTGVRGADQVQHHVVLAAESLRHHDDVLAALADGAEVHGGRLDRGDRHLVPQALDVAHGRQVCLLGAVARRHVDAAPTLQLPRLLGKLAPVAREFDRIERRHRLHEGHEVGWPERRQHEVRQRLARSQRARHLVDVVLVPEDQEHPHVVALRLLARVAARSDRQRRPVHLRRLAARLDQLERRDRLRHVVLLDDEVLHRQIGDQASAAIEHRDVDAHDLGVDPDRGLPLFLLGRLLCRWGLVTGAGAHRRRAGLGGRQDRHHPRHPRQPRQFHHRSPAAVRG